MRLAANILLLFGTILTTNYVLSATAYNWYIWPLVFFACALVQYVVTKIESALFTGAIPSPWSTFRSTKTTWIWFGAIIILLMDIIINLGGVGTIARFIKESDSGQVLENEFGATKTGLNLITGFMILALALLVAIGPELARMFAEILETPLNFKEIRSEQPRSLKPEIEQPRLISEQPSDIQEALQAARRNNNFEIPRRNQND